MPQLKFNKMHSDAQVPTYGSEHAACFDLYSIHSDYLHSNYSSAIFNTGLAFEIPIGWVMLIFSRSGHGFKSDVRLANCVGVIDADYRGEVMVKLTLDVIDELSGMRVNRGDRIAQAMLVPVETVEFIEADQLSDTERGAGGFGSTGA